MSLEENKSIVRRLYEEFFNQGNLNLADELFAPHYINRSAPAGRAPGPEGVKQSGFIFRTAFPDFHNTIEDLIAEGDKVVVRFTTRGTHQGTFMGIPPTGKPVQWTGIDIFTIVGGKFVEAWGNYDELSLLQQLR